MTILPINKIFREKKFAILIAVDSNSKWASLKQTYIDNLEVSIFRGTVSISLLPPRHRCERAEDLLPPDKELPVYSSLLYASYINFWSSQQLGIAAQCWKFSIINFPFQQVSFFFSPLSLQRVGEIGSEVDVFQVEIISTVSLNHFSSSWRYWGMHSVSQDQCDDSPASQENST